MKYILQLLILIIFLPLLSCKSGRNTSDSTVDFYYLDDDENKYSLQDVINMNKAGDLIPGSQKLNLGYDLSNAWAYMRVPKPELVHIIIFENAHLDHIVIYCYKDDKLLKILEGGDSKPFSYRSLVNNYPNFILPENTNSIYLNISSEGPLIAPISVYPTAKFFEYIQKFNFLIGLYFGFIILILVSVITIYLWTKEALNLYYASFILISGFITTVDLGYLFQFVWPNRPELNNKIIPFLYLSEFFLLFYIDRVLEIRKKTKFLKYLYNGIYLSVPILVIVFNFISYESSVKLLLYAGFAIPIISLYSIIYLLTQKKSTYYTFMLVGIVVYLITAGISILTSIGVFAFSLVTGLILQIGTGFQIIFFNLGVLSKINVLTKEKETIMQDQNRILTESNKELKKANQDLDDFIYTASHDLRVPLANIQGLNNALKEIECKTEEEIELHNIIKMIDDSLTKQEKTIMILTQIGKIQRMKELDIQEVYLKKIIDNALKRYNDLIKECNATIVMKQDKFPSIYFSETNCQSIVNSLIKNALLYRSPDRNLIITISYKETDNYIELTVEDNGVGIKEGYQNKVFGLFTRLNTDVEGSGLGLYMTKQILENYDSKIDYESEYGKWTRFTVYFKKNLSQTI